jgi:hypothetical protein
LYHEIGNDAVEYNAIVVFALSEAAEIVARLGCMVGIQLDGDGTLDMLINNAIIPIHAKLTKVVSSATSVVIVNCERSNRMPADALDVACVLRIEFISVNRG